MKPEKGQHVKCFMRSSMALEGFVEDWSEAQVVLKSLDGQNIIIVHKPTDDIMLTKIILQELSEEKSKSPPSEIKEQIREKLHETLHSGDSDLETKNLQQLRKMLVEQDKQIIVQKRKEHFGTAGNAKRAVPYSNPFTTKK